MREYTYQDVTDAGWIVPQHGFDTVTLTMAIVIAVVIFALYLGKDKL